MIIYNMYHECEYSLLDNNTLNNIKKNYKIINIDYFDYFQVYSKIFNDDYFKDNQKKVIINNMVNYYINNKNINIYTKTDYLCIEKEKICICNKNAENFRKIYDGLNYKQDNKYISWIKKQNEHF